MRREARSIRSARSRLPAENANMARILIIAYTTFVYDGRVKRHAESLAARGDSVDVIALRSGHEGLQNGVNVIGVPMDRS